MRLSASLIKRWMGCPLQVRFDKTEKRPQQVNAKTAFGTCMHDALEMYNKTGDLDKSLSRFYFTWSHPEVFDSVPEVWPRGTTYGSLKAKGEEVLRTYDSGKAWDKRDIIAAEHRFMVPLGDHHLSGMVDMIELKNKTLFITDFKTSSRQPTFTNLALDIQFTVYVYASTQREFWVGFGDDYPGLPNGEQLFEEFKDIPRKAIWHNLWSNKEVFVGDRDENDYLRLYRCMVEIANAIEKDVYIPSINGDTCTWCPYTDICQVVAPVRDKVQHPSTPLAVL